MNSNIYETNERRNIQPSARPSIHSYHSRETMVRYRHHIKKRELNNLPAQGVDEVDNVMSKMYSSKYSITGSVSHHKLCIRLTIDTSNDTADDTSDENILSKSSPPSFPSSSENYNTASESDMLSAHDRDRISSRHNNSSRRGYSYENLGTESNNGCNKSIYIILPILVCGLGVISYNYISNESRENYVYDTFSFFNDVKDLGEKYKVENNSILQLKIGISTIFENEDTGSFIFTYDSNEKNFNPLKLDQFVEDISAKSSKYLRNETKQVQPVVVNISNQLVHNEKEFINLYQSEINKWGVMLVKDVDNIPSHLAMAFHYYCDEYNPLIKKSAIFFTLNLAKCSNGSNRRSTHDYVEKCLARKWNSVKQDRIRPLLTRVVNVVIDVTSIC